MTYRSILVLKLLIFRSLGSVCPNFYRIVNAEQGNMASNIVDAWGVSVWENSPETGSFQQKMQGVLCLYPSAPPELIAFIQKIQAIGD